MELQSPPSSAASRSTTQPPPRPQLGLQQTHSDTYLQMLEGPVVAVKVGSGLHATTYNLPVALLCFHSHFFKQDILCYDSVRARANGNGNKKRKVSTEDEPVTVKVEKVDDETEVMVIAPREHHPEEGTVIRLPEVDPAVFGLFLKYVYMGFYPATVDAQAGSPHSIPHTSKPTHYDSPYTPAKAAMPPPATINSRQALPGSHPRPSPTPNPNNPQIFTTASIQDGSPHSLIPPSIHAYLLSVRLSAPGFLNQALNHIYYGIGKYFALTPDLVDYICTRMASTSTLRKLILDVLVVHWPSSSTHIVAKYPALNKRWNEVFDAHKDLRHGFTMGLQGSVKVLPVQAYFVSTAPSTVAKKEEVREREVEVVEVRNTQVDTSAAEAAAEAAAAEQNNGSPSEGKK